MPLNRWILPLGAAFCLLPFVTAPMALGLGIAVALTIGNPEIERSRKWTKLLLNLSIIGLGAGMDLHAVGRAGAQGAALTFVGIVLTLALGLMLGKLFGTEADTSLLISSGTAICGGSAIAAVGSTIQAKPHQMSVALGTVFLLNSLALLIFPWIGRKAGLSQESFGLWCALAIHDTSSVVGAATQFGARALEVGTTVKLARALWIVPMTLGIGTLRRDRGKLPQPPWFILGFLAASACVTYLPELKPIGSIVLLLAKRLLILTLFLIGANLTRDTLRQVGFRPLLQGAVLWLVVAASSLGLILMYSSA